MTKPVSFVLAFPVILAGIAVVGVLAGPARLSTVPVAGGVALTAGFLPVGFFLVRYRPENRTSWAMWFIGFTALCFLTCAAWSGWLVGAWLTQWVWWVPLATVPIALTLFPDGDPDNSRIRLRRTLSASGAWAAMFLAAAAIGAPWTLATSISDPLSPMSMALVWCAVGGVLVTLGGAMVAAWSLVSRARRLRGKFRHQVLCLAPCAVLLPVVAVLDAAGVPYAYTPVALALPLGMGVAVVRHQLDDLDVVLRRSSVWAVVTVTVMAIYAAVLFATQRIFPFHTMVWSVLVLSVTAALFDAIRIRFQRAVDQTLFGQRDNPYGVLVATGQRMQAAANPTSMLAGLADTIVETLRVPYVRIDINTPHGVSTVAHTGRPLVPPVEFPLTLNDEILGVLAVSPRSVQDTFTAREVQLLTATAGHASLAADGYRLMAAVQQAREDLILSREEERDRLGCEVHDRLLTTLAGATFQLGSVIASVPAPQASVLEAAKADLNRARTTAREIVRSLKPSELEAGLENAIRQSAGSLLGTTDFAASFRIDRAPPLAVQSAALYITKEALSNISRHAHATRCDLELVSDDTGLQLIITDNGHTVTTSGQPASDGTGIGLRSMRNRAEELGGYFIFKPTTAGASVTVRIPPHKQPSHPAKESTTSRR